MKEMDPSEELEFEHLMREDENLIIEVESLRATGHKISKLPLKNPPQQLIKKIIYEANQLQTSRLNKFQHFNSPLLKSLAAAVVLSALTGGYFYFQQPVESVNSRMQANTESANISPWVDRNEVITWPQQNSASTAGTINWSNEIKNSYEKLQLVKYFNNGTQVYPGMHLTGASE